jgi:hypothetical protein
LKRKVKALGQRQSDGVTSQRAGLFDSPSKSNHAFESGTDFADALHVARSTRASAFVTFDRQLARRAKALPLSPAVEWLNRAAPRHKQ